MSDHSPDPVSTDDAGPRRRRTVRLLLVVGLAWVLVATTAVVFAVLWFGDAEDRQLAREVRVTTGLWDEEVQDLRRIDAEHGTLWTLGGRRPTALADSGAALVDPGGTDDPYLLTVPDALALVCTPGAETRGERTRVTACGRTEEGWGILAQANVTTSPASSPGSVRVFFSVPRPGGTDVRLDLSVDVPGAPPSGLPETRRFLRSAVALAPEVLEATGYGPIQAVDMDSPAWSDYDRLLGPGAVGSLPAPLRE